MAIPINPYAGQTQAAIVNPFVQRSEDQDRRTEQRDDSSSRAETRPASAPAADSEKSAPVHHAARERGEDSESSSGNGQRGSLVNLSV